MLIIYYGGTVCQCPTFHVAPKIKDKTSYYFTFPIHYICDQFFFFLSSGHTRSFKFAFSNQSAAATSQLAADYISNIISLDYNKCNPKKETDRLQIRKSSFEFMNVIKIIICKRILCTDEKEK